MRRRQIEDEIINLQLDTEDVVLETAELLKRHYNAKMDEVIDKIALWYLKNDIHTLVDAQLGVDSLMSELDEVLDEKNEEYISTMTEHFALVFALNLQETERIFEFEVTEDEEALLLFGALGLASIAWDEDGLTYADRMRLKNEALKDEIRQIILRNAALGSGSQKLLNDIYHEMSKSTYRGKGTLLDESVHVANEAVRYAAEQLFDGYVILETLDARTCKHCNEAHGKFFTWDQYEVGLTAPKFHPNCRGRICPANVGEF